MLHSHWLQEPGKSPGPVKCYIFKGPVFRDIMSVLYPPGANWAFWNMYLAPGASALSKNRVRVIATGLQA